MVEKDLDVNFSSPANTGTVKREPTREHELLPCWIN
jgi:hypothetical protein